MSDSDAYFILQGFKNDDTNDDSFRGLDKIS